MWERLYSMCTPFIYYYVVLMIKLKLFFIAYYVLSTFYKIIKFTLSYRSSKSYIRGHQTRPILLHTPYLRLCRNRWRWLQNKTFGSRFGSGQRKAAIQSSNWVKETVPRTQHILGYWGLRGFRWFRQIFETGKYPKTDFQLLLSFVKLNHFSPKRFWIV